MPSQTLPSLARTLFLTFYLMFFFVHTWRRRWKRRKKDISVPKRKGLPQRSTEYCCNVVKSLPLRLVIAERFSMMPSSVRSPHQLPNGPNVPQHDARIRFLFLFVSHGELPNFFPHAALPNPTQPSQHTPAAHECAGRSSDRISGPFRFATAKITNHLHSSLIDLRSSLSSDWTKPRLLSFKTIRDIHSSV